MSVITNSIDKLTPSLGVTGSSSGTVTIAPQTAAGTYNFNLPTTAGTSGYFLTSAGGGSSPMTWTTYATGSWTPGFAFGGGTTGITYTDQIGEYTQIGNVVYFSLLIKLSSKGSSTGVVTVTGAPVTTTASEQDISVASLSSLTSYDSGFFSAALSTQASTTFKLYEIGTGTYQQMTDENFADNTRIETNGFYFIS